MHPSIAPITPEQEATIGRLFRERDTSTLRGAVVETLRDVQDENTVSAHAAASLILALRRAPGRPGPGGTRPATPFQRRVLHDLTVTVAPQGPTGVVAGRADTLALAVRSSEAAVTRALRALEAAGRVERVALPGLTIDGWVTR